MLLRQSDRSHGRRRKEADVSHCRSEIVVGRSQVVKAENRKPKTERNPNAESRNSGGDQRSGVGSQELEAPAGFSLRAFASWRLSVVAIFLFLLLCACAFNAPAASSSERRAFQKTLTPFKDGFYETAERDLTEFIRKYPQSEYRPDAILMLAQATFKLLKYTNAAALLQKEYEQAGKLADEYSFWIAESHYYDQQYPQAAEAYARILREYPFSKRRLEAAVGEAYCRFKNQDYLRVRQLLSDPEGDFQKMVRSKPNADQLVRGYLLLGETLLLQKEYQAGEQALNELASVTLRPELAWRRQNLLCRIRVADQRYPEALTASVDLMKLAEQSQQKPLIAEAVELQGGIYERLGQFAEAAKVYERNLGESATAEQRRLAVLKIIQLNLVLKRTAETIEKLEAFVRQNPTDGALDLVQLTLGELRLKEFVKQSQSSPAITNETATSGTNLLGLAQSHFEHVTADFPQSDYFGKASLNRGWCLWLLGQIENAQTWFRQAAEKLPVGEEQAVARFKLADAYLWQKNYTNALEQYLQLSRDYAAQPKFRSELMDQVYYQLLRGSIESDNQPMADYAFTNLLQKFPNSYYAERSMLMFGLNWNRVDQPAKARQVFEDFLARFPQSELGAEADLAIARTFAQEEKWAESIRKYDTWALRRGARDLRPQAEFDRAWTHYQAGQETNALRLFTNFVTQFATHALAPQAQYWVAGFYFRRSDFENAERNYQILFQNTNWPVTEITFQARMMAGRAALARQGVKDAGDYFKSVINDDRCLPNLVAEALFAWGDTMLEEPSAGTNAPQRFLDAKAAFERIPQIYATNRLVSAAWGRIADCYLQLAATEPAYYEMAATNYQHAILPSAPIPVRSQAEVGLGIVREKQARLKTDAQRTAWLKEAMDHYLNVVYGKNLRDDEFADPFWVSKAGLAAAALAESQGDWDAATRLYERLKAVLPAMQELCDRRLKIARKQAQKK